MFLSYFVEINSAVQSLSLLGTSKPSTLKLLNLMNSTIVDYWLKIFVHYVIRQSIGRASGRFH